MTSRKLKEWADNKDSDRDYNANSQGVKLGNTPVSKTLACQSRIKIVRDNIRQKFILSSPGRDMSPLVALAELKKEVSKPKHSRHFSLTPRHLLVHGKMICKHRSQFQGSGTPTSSFCFLWACKGLPVLSGHPLAMPDLCLPQPALLPPDLLTSLELGERCWDLWGFLCLYVLTVK